MKLKKSNVVFNEDKHTYFLGDKQLEGITGRLGASTLFRDKYKGIPKAILKNAATRGSNIHRQIELMDKGLPYVPIPETVSYTKLKEEFNIVPKFNEFIVTDGEKYATPIDMGDVELNTYDHKTTSLLDIEYVSWQLSMCGYLFEKQTGLQTKKQFVIHFKKDHSCILVEVPKKTDQEVYDMFYTDKYMGEDTPSAVPVLIPSDTLTLIKDIETEILDMEAKMKSFNEKKAELLAFMRGKMEENNLDKVTLGSLNFTIKKDYVRESFDSKELLKDHPEFVGKYLKSSVVKGNISLTLK